MSICNCCTLVIGCLDALARLRFYNSLADFITQIQAYDQLTENTQKVCVSMLNYVPIQQGILKRYEGVEI